ncbi:unnamed protein product [Caenorhabditis auriculariae]|uniref:Potassium channel domain-containing protein n=1 Tax=Caenorhabditis auriculariae TaxID=2777116 RepID=A0A8S1HB47_9PELO|nr:unnamed protein product [Caenorhabditis auriculariae]
MPVLLRSFGGIGGGRQQQHRPASAQNSQLGEHGRTSSNSTNRRVSQLSATPSTADALHERILQSRVHANDAAVQQEKKLNIRKIFQDAYKRYHIKYLFPLIFIMFYMLIGAFIFYFLESGTAEDVAAGEAAKYKQERRRLLLRLEEVIRDKSLSGPRKFGARKDAFQEAVNHYESQLQFAVKDESQWSFMSAMYFAGTLFTTIGYGDIACLTTSGRILTVIYSCVGIPLMLITLNDLGKFLYNNINGCVKGFEDFGAYLGVMKICGRRREIGKVDELVALESGEAVQPEVSSLASEAGSLHNESELELDVENMAPRMSVKVALGITIGWIFFCSALFKIWEDWTYGESLYFMFISLSTIGLGDISVARRDMMVLCFAFVIVGLSLVSMSINVVQVALEEFYVSMMMKLIMEYQEKLAAGGDQMGASVGMMRMWGNNRAAKLLMPLMSKEKRRIAMAKVEQEAKKEGIEVPAILTDLDEKTGMPKLLLLEEHKEGAEPPKALEEMVQKQIQIEEAAVDSSALFAAHDADTQTEVVVREEKSHQTDEKQYTECVVQTDRVEMKATDDQLKAVETQTETIQQNVVETQTIYVESADAQVATVSAPVLESESQTEHIQTREQELQTYIAECVDAEASTEVEMKSIRIQTPSPVIEQKCIQTEDMEEYRKSPSKMSSAKKRLRRAFAGKSKTTRSSLEHPAMSEWREVDEDEVQEDDPEEVEDEGSVESLHWDPVDGMHAEKQLPVKRLKALFDSPKATELDRRKIQRKFSSFSKRGDNRSRRTSE